MTQSSIGDNEKVIAEMQKQIDELKKLVLSASEQKVEEPKKKVKREPVEKQPKKELLAPNTYIKIMSLVDNPLNLNTRPHGRGKAFRFETFGTIKSVFYSELLEIIENHPNFFQAGYFYILDPRVIEENNYHEIYSKILSKEQMEAIFSNSANAIALFAGTNSKQQAIIVDYFVEKLVSGVAIDMNLISAISKISGIDILKKSEDAKEINKK